MKSNRIARAAVVVFLGLLGCGGSKHKDKHPVIPQDAGGEDASSADAGEADAGPPPSPIALADFCARHAARSFAYWQLCDGKRLLPDDQRTSEVAEATAACMRNERGIQAGRIGYDPIAAARCVQSDVVRENCELDNAFDACTGVFTPKAPLGSACENDLGLDGSDSDCKEGLCELAARSCQGTCRKGAGVGEKCDVRECASELSCNDQKVCEPRIAGAALGAACGDGVPCEDATCVGGTCVRKVEHGERCDINAHNCWWPEECIDPNERWGNANPTVCGAPTANGKPCQASFQCQSNHCELGLCANTPTLGEQCSYRCAAGLYCKWYEGAPPKSSCAKLGNDGDRCDDAVNSQLTSCVDGAGCFNDGKCHTLGDVDGTCIVELENCKNGLWCNPETTKCAQALDDGSPCTDGRQCKGWCGDDGKCYSAPMCN